MDAYEIIDFIKNSKKRTPVKVYVKCTEALCFSESKVFGEGSSFTVFGDWPEIEMVLKENRDKVVDFVVESDCRNSAVPMLDLLGVNARVEPGAFVREGAKIHDGAVVMMGAVVNIGAVVGNDTMVDMNAVLGGRAMVGKRCHIGAGSVLAGVIEPPSKESVVIEDDVFIGANAVILEGVRVGKGSVVAAGSVVASEVPAGVVVGGTPARVLKVKDEKTEAGTTVVGCLRKL